MPRPPAGGRDAAWPAGSAAPRAWVNIVGLSASTPPGRGPVGADLPRRPGGPPRAPAIAAPAIAAPGIAAPGIAAPGIGCASWAAGTGGRRTRGRDGWAGLPLPRRGDLRSRVLSPPLSR